MRQREFALCVGNSPHYDKYIEKAKYLGYKIHYIHKKDDVDHIPSNLNIKLNLPVPVFNYELETVGYINEKFNLNGPKLNSINIIANKINFFHFLKKHNMPRPKFCLIPQNTHDFDCTYPAIIKPWDFSGSIGVKVVHNKKEAVEYTKHFQKPILGRNINCKFLIEELVKGKYLGLNAFIVNRHLYVWGQQSAETHYRNSLYRVMPLYYTDESEIPSTDIKCLEKLFKLAGIDNSTVQIELVVSRNTNKIINIIEINLRSGVTGLDCFDKMYHGKDLIEQSILLAAGKNIHTNHKLKNHMCSLRPNLGSGKILNVKWPKKKFEGLVIKNLKKNMMINEDPKDTNETFKIGKIVALNKDLTKAIKDAKEYEKNIMTIRKLNYQDIEVFWDEICSNKKFLPISYTSYIDDRASKEHPGNPIVIYLGAFLGKQLVGVSSFFQTKKGKYQIKGFYVKSEFRNRGIDSFLLETGMSLKCGF